MKKLIPAICMTLLAAAMFATSTFAWFSMNTTVQATGMKVTAKSDAIFLQIKGTEDSDYSSTGRNALDAKLYPVAHETWSKLSDITDFDLNDDSTNDNWYYRYSSDSGDHDANLTEKVYISAFTDYVATTSYSVKLHEGSAEKGYDLYVSEISIPANTGITVVIAGTNGYQEFSASATEIAFDTSNIITNEVTATESTVNVYIYINGDDANVYTDNVTALTGSISFKLTAFAADHS